MAPIKYFFITFQKLIKKILHSVVKLSTTFFTLLIMETFF